MENNPELDGKYLGTISQDFAVVSNTLREAAHQLSFRKISDFPIFPISKSELPIGQLLIGRKEMASAMELSFLLFGGIRAKKSHCRRSGGRIQKVFQKNR